MLLVFLHNKIYRLWQATFNPGQTQQSVVHFYCLLFFVCLFWRCDNEVCINNGARVTRNTTEYDFEIYVFSYKIFLLLSLLYSVVDDNIQIIKKISWKLLSNSFLWQLN